MSPSLLQMRTLVVVLLACGCAAGCRDAQEAPATNAPQAELLAPPAAVELTIQVAGDVELAEGLRLLRGEWKARTGGELKVDSLSLEEFLAAPRLAGDVVLFPARQLGALVVRGDLRPVRASTLKDAAFGLGDVYPAIRDAEMKFADETYALPLGSPPLLSFRKFQPTGANAPSTPKAVVPTDGLSGAYSLILRGLGYAESYRRREALFDPADMTPRVADPPFVRALVELSADNAVRAAELSVGFAEAMRLVGQGEAAATLGWPSALNEQFAAAEGVAPRDVEFAAVPPGVEIYSSSRGAWERETNPTPITLLGVEGRLVAVTTATRNAVAAFQLAQWLTSGDVAVGLSSRSTGTLWYRASQASASNRWMKRLQVAPGAEPVTKIIANSLGVDSPILIPRIPAIDEYLAVLAEAVRTAPADEAAAKQALEDVATKWEEITERLNREKQATAYRQHLGEAK